MKELLEKFLWLFWEWVAKMEESNQEEAIKKFKEASEMTESLNKKAEETQEVDLKKFFESDEGKETLKKYADLFVSASTLQEVMEQVKEASNQIEDLKKQVEDLKKEKETDWLLSKFRVIPMSWPTKEIGKILDNWKFLRPWGEYKRTRWGWVADVYKFGTDMIKLVSKDVEWLVYISDQELADNVEGKNWESHVKKMCAKKISNEIVEDFIVKIFIEVIIKIMVDFGYLLIYLKFYLLLERVL